MQSVTVTMLTCNLVQVQISLDWCFYHYCQEYYFLVQPQLSQQNYVGSEKLFAMMTLFSGIPF